MRSRIEKKVFGALSVLPFILMLGAFILNCCSFWSSGVSIDFLDIVMTPLETIQDTIPEDWFTLIHNILDAFDVVQYQYFDIIITCFMWSLFSYFLYMVYLILAFIPKFIVKRFDID